MKWYSLITIYLMLFFSCVSCVSVSPPLKPLDLESDMVIIYSASWCHVCKEAKAFLDEHHVNYVELNYENEQEFKRLLHIARDLNYHGVFDRIPIFIVRKYILVGYSPDAILWILGGEFK
jgi:glutaredoxin-related protein